MPAPRKSMTHDPRVRRVPTAAEVEITPTGAEPPDPDTEWHAEVLTYWAAYTSSAAAPAFTDAEWAEVRLRFVGLNKVFTASKWSHYAFQAAVDGIASVEKAVIARHKAGYTGKKAAPERKKYTMDEMKQMYGVK